MKVNLLKARMFAAGYTTTTLLAELEKNDAKMCESAWYRKCSGLTEFTRDELEAITKVLNLNAADFREIFFNI